MGHTGVHSGQRYTLTTTDKDFRQFLSILTLGSLMHYLYLGDQEELMERVTLKHQWETES